MSDSCPKFRLRVEACRSHDTERSQAIRRCLCQLSVGCAHQSRRSAPWSCQSSRPKYPALRESVKLTTGAPYHRSIFGPLPVPHSDDLELQEQTYLQTEHLEDRSRSTYQKPKRAFALHSGTTYDDLMTPPASHPRVAKIVLSELQLVEARRKIVDNSSSNLKPRRLVITKGSFDLLHAGHLSLFATCARIAAEAGQAEVLVVVESDASVRRRKGERRPYQSGERRALQVALVPNVDHVLVADYSELPRIFETLAPVAYVKGMDTAIQGHLTESDDWVELNPDINPEVSHLPGDCRLVVFADDGDLSTSMLVKKIASASAPSNTREAPDK